MREAHVKIEQVKDNLDRFLGLMSAEETHSYIQGLKRDLTEAQDMLKLSSNDLDEVTGTLINQHI